MILRVERIGPGSTLQDSGRPGWRRFGVGPSGAFDRESHLLANALLGNALEATVLEIGPFGATFVAESPGFAAIAGAHAKLTLGDQKWATNTAFVLQTGDRLELDPPIKGVRSYLALPGGIQGPIVLDSSSGTQIQANVSLASESPAPELNRHPVQNPIRRLVGLPSGLHDRPLRVLPVEFPGGFALEVLTEGAFRATPQMDRIGVKLSGPSLGNPGEFPSEPCCFGAIQVTPDGSLFILGPDGPTIGGYPKIAVVIQADCDRVAQLTPNHEVRFQWTTLEDASEALREWHCALQGAIKAIAPLG